VVADQSSVPGEALLHAARAVLAGEVDLPPGRRTRAAALLARTALEDLVSYQFARISSDPIRQMRAKIICLSVMGDAEQAERASWAYTALSRACHHHAYELAPTHAEVAHLIDLVAELQTCQVGRPG
jgi:hypothetical protein